MTEKDHAQAMVDKLVQAITANRSVRTIKAEAGASLQGRNGSHQVDVYWEFSDGEITYKTIIQTSYWDKVIGNNELFRLLSTLRDIPGQVAGVLFTQPVYQKLTRELARDVGIALYEVRLPVEHGVWEPLIDNINIRIDAEWAKAEKERLGLGEQQVQLGGEPKAMFIYDAAGNCIDSVQGVFNDYIKNSRAGRQFEQQTIVHEFGEPAYLQTTDEQFPQVKLNQIVFDLTFFDSTEVQGEEMAEHILADVLKYFKQ